MSNIAPIRRDPIGDKYFKPLEIAERCLNISFYVAAVLSFAALLVERVEHPALYDFVQIAFVLIVLFVFVSGIAIRLYWRPNAEDKRRAELITSASHVALTVERTEGYYNNDETDPTRRLGVMLLENSYFSKSVALKMLSRERSKIVAYLVLFLVAVLCRKTDLAFAATAAQAIFSEQLLSRWLRLEWLHVRFENIFRQLYVLFQWSAP
jgi:Na+/proline symporter